ncbi:solute carrier family 22 member 18-like [Branchiostoma floridae x Branchiostoma belcheri]
MFMIPENTGPDQLPKLVTCVARWTKSRKSVRQHIRRKIYFLKLTPSTMSSNKTSSSSTAAAEVTKRQMGPEKPAEVTEKEKQGRPEELVEGSDRRYQMGEGEKTRLLTIVRVTNALHQMCLTMNKGALPYLTKRLNLSNTLWGHLITATALLQFIGNPLVGRFGDVYGGRMSLTLSCVAMATFAVMLSTCDSFSGLLLTKVPFAFSHAPTSQQMLISDVTDDAARTTEMGTLRILTYVGHMVGSAIGGTITETYGTTATFLCTAMLSCVSALLAWIYIPADTKPRRDKNKNVPKSRGIVSLSDIVRPMQTRAVAHLLGIRFSFIMANQLILNSFPIILRDNFEMGPQEAGMFTMYSTLASVVLQVVLIRPLTKRYKDFPLLMLASLALTTSYMTLTCMTENWHLYVYAILKNFGVILRNNVVLSALSKAAPGEDTGTVMALGAMVESLTQIISPPISAYFLDHVGYQYLGATSSTITAMVTGFMFLTREEFK